MTATAYPMQRTTMTAAQFCEWMAAHHAARPAPTLEQAYIYWPDATQRAAGRAGVMVGQHAFDLFVVSPT